MPWVPPRAEAKYEIWVPPSRNARYTPWAPPNGARGFVPWNPANPTIPIGLPTQPFHQTEELWHWLAQARAHSRVYPPWYHGFVDKSRIEIKVRPIDSTSGEYVTPGGWERTALICLRFFRPNGEQSCSLTREISIQHGGYIPIKGKDDSYVNNVFRIAEKIGWNDAIERRRRPDNNEHNELVATQKIPFDMGRFGVPALPKREGDTWNDVVKKVEGERTALLIECEPTDNYIPNDKGWYGCPSRDDFSHIVIENRSHEQVHVVGVKVTLNTIVILDEPYDVRLSSGEKLDLVDDIKNYRRESVRKHLVGGGSLPPTLQVAADEIGKSYDTKYRGGWYYLEEWGYWVYRPVSFCTEFSSWTIRQATNLKPPQLDLWGVEENLGFEHLVDFFHERGQWLGNHNCDQHQNPDFLDVLYRHLGTRVRPGDWCCENEPGTDNGHSMFFIGWCNPSTGKPAVFNPSDDYSTFWTVSGNWNIVNQARMCTISRNRQYDAREDVPIKGLPHIRWGCDLNGFGRIVD